MEKIRGVFFDLEGTLLTCGQDPGYQEQARARMAALAGQPDPEAFCRAVDERYASYRSWAASEKREAGDFELWAKWLLPEMDKERLAAVCRQLTFQYRQTMGLRRPVPGGLRTVRRLYERGCRLGIVSNLIGEEEIFNWLQESGLSQYFDAVVLSSLCHVRKPDPEIYRIACRELDLEPEACAAVTGGLDGDAACAGEAGLGACILLAGQAEQAPGGDRPGCVVSRLPEILDLPIFQ